MRGERRVDHLRPDRLQPVECPVLVTPDQAPIDCRVGGKDRGRTAGQAEAYRGKLRRRRGPRSPARVLRFSSPRGGSGGEPGDSPCGAGSTRAVPRVSFRPRLCSWAWRAAFTGADADKPPFELRHAGEHRQHQAAGHFRGISPVGCPNIYFEPDVAAAEERGIPFTDGAQALLERAPAP